MGRKRKHVYIDRTQKLASVRFLHNTSQSVTTTHSFVAIAYVLFYDDMFLIRLVEKVLNLVYLKMSMLPVLLAKQDLLKKDSHINCAEQMMIIWMPIS